METQVPHGSSGPRKIYLDQNIVSHFTRVSDWRTEDEYGRVISKAINDKTAEVWISPAHFMELTQLAKVTIGDDDSITFVPSDQDKHRQNLAQIILDLSEGRHILPGIDSQISLEFARFMNDLCHNEVARIDLFEEIVRTQRVAFLGGLALMASLPNYLSEDVFLHVKRSKIETQFIHAEAAKDPDKFVGTLSKIIYSNPDTSFDFLQDYQSLSITECERNIKDVASRLKTEPTRWSDDTKRRWNRDKAAIMFCYSIDSISRYLTSTLKMIWERLFAFNPKLLLESIPDIQSQIGPLSMRQSVEEMNTRLHQGGAYLELQGSLITSILNSLKRAVTQKRARFTIFPVNAAHIEMAIVVNLIERGLEQGNIPLPSLVLDSSHAIAIEYCDIFVTEDSDFKNSLNKVKGALNLSFEICDNPGQLERKLH